MKKLITILALTTAVVSQAATLTWGLSQIKSSADTTAPGAGYLGLLFVVDTTSDPAVTVDSITGLLDAGKVADAAALATYSKAANDNGLISSAGNGSYSEGDSITAFAVVLDAANASSAKNYIVTGEMTKTWGKTGNQSMQFGSQANATYTKIGGSSDQPDVPEPATGALALAGVALLFRRRRA